MGSRGHKNSGNRSSGGGFQVKHVAIALSVIALAYFAFRKRSEHLAFQSKTTSPAPVQDNIPEILPEQSNQGFNKDAYAKEIQASRRKIHGERVLGIKSLRVKRVKGDIQIPFEFSARKVWCQGGDLDTIRYAVSAKDSEEVLISLESMKSDKVKESLYVSSDKLRAGFQHVFKIDDDTPKGSLALSICLDRKKSKSCKKAQVLDQKTLNDKIAANSNKADGDYLFYFQHILFDGQTIQSYRSDVYSARFKKNLLAYLSKADVPSEISQRAWKMNGTIKSNPLDIVDGKIKLTLPYNDPRCVPGNT